MERSDRNIEQIGASCPVCGSTDIYLFVEIPQVPVNCNCLCRTYEQAVNVKRGDIRLGFCRRCCHIFNLAFCAEQIQYDVEYENSLYFSPRFQKYAAELVGRLIDSYDLHDKMVLEIGCGKGDFLKMLCEEGPNRGVGFDPSYDGRYDNNDRITFVRDFYKPSYNGYKVDIVCCRQVLEHVYRPGEFLADIHKVAKTGDKVNVFFEVPNVMFTLRDHGIWDLIYEHCCYYCAESLEYLFARSGFVVSDCREEFGGQFLSIEAMPINRPLGDVETITSNGDQMSDYVGRFADEYERRTSYWRRKLEQIRNEGRRAVVWGAGSKGVTFLNVFGALDAVQYVVDINPYKQGKYVAGTGQRIVGPWVLRNNAVNVIIVMNSIYGPEIRKSVEQLKLDCEIVYA